MNDMDLLLVGKRRSYTVIPRRAFGRPTMRQRLRVSFRSTALLTLNGKSDTRPRHTHGAEWPHAIPAARVALAGLFGDHKAQSRGRMVKSFLPGEPPAAGDLPTGERSFFSRSSRPVRRERAFRWSAQVDSVTDVRDEVGSQCIPRRDVSLPPPRRLDRS